MRGLRVASIPALMAWTLSATLAAEMPSLMSLGRPLRSQPVYRSKRPLYGLAAFGPKAEKVVWLVLDQSKPDNAPYDVLYIDLNANGDLTEEGERLKLGADSRFRLPTFIDPATGIKHRELTVRTDGAKPTVMFNIQWRGQTRFGGGYPQDPEEGYLAFATRPADAPFFGCRRIHRSAFSAGIAVSSTSASRTISRCFSVSQVTGPVPSSRPRCIFCRTRTGCARR